MNLKAHSPYLNDPKRLADVIAAIQAAATYKFYKLDFAWDEPWLLGRFSPP